MNKLVFPGNVIITGGSSGLGSAVVDAVLKAGGTPLVIDIAKPSVDVDHEIVDISNTRQAEQAVVELARRNGAINGVVTAAGTDACGKLEDIDSQAWEKVVMVNLLGTVAIVRAALPYLIESQGNIVTVGSTLGLRALSDASAYCASKFGVVGFSRSLMIELAGRVGVTLLVPGGMDTAFFDGRDEQYKPGPDAQLMKPQDAAEAVLFALSQSATSQIRELIITPPTEPSYP